MLTKTAEVNTTEDADWRNNKHQELQNILV